MSENIKKYFENIVGYNQTKEELIPVAIALREDAKRQEFGIKAPKGILFYGEPGVGKTTIAKDLIDASGRFAVEFRKDYSRDKFITALKNTFELAKENQPSVILLDDMDKFSNSDDDLCDTEEYVAVQSYIDSIKDDDVFVVATANDTSCFPESLLRPGRFDRRIAIDVPSPNEAATIIKSYLDKIKHEDDIDEDTIAKLMVGKSGAAIETVINEAGINAIARNLSKVSMECIVDACLTVFFHSPEGSNYLTSKDAKIFAIHEAGHAVVQELLVPNSVALVSTRINSRNPQGITVFDNGWISYCDDYHIKIIMCALAGRAAVEIKYGIVDPGSSLDVAKAASIAYDAITRWCCNGIMKPSDIFSSTSQQLKYQQEIEMNAMLSQYYIDVKKLLVDRFSVVENVASELFEKRTLLGKDVRRIISADKLN